MTEEWQCEVETFSLAAVDPFLEVLIGTIEEPNGSETARRAGEATRQWWDTHGSGPTRAELINEVFPNLDWATVIDDPRRSLAHRREQGALVEAWFLSYWSRLGVISYVPGDGDVITPGLA